LRKRFLQLKEVSECFHASGDDDIVKIHASDVKAYREFLVAKLTAIKHIASMRSRFSINEVKNSNEILL